MTISAVFDQLTSEGRKAFIPFLTLGDPSLEATERLLLALPQAGADIIEVGIPFSDPIADGPIIQASYTRALYRGFKMNDGLAALQRITSSPNWRTPIVAMISYSLIYRMGYETFLKRAKEVGLSGLIIPDLPVDEADAFGPLVRSAGLDLILLVTPTTTAEREAKIFEVCSGFVYVVSRVGITGEQTSLAAALGERLKRYRSLTKLPLCVGFGVSSAEHVRELKEIADGAIIGSALVKKLESPDAESVIPQMVRELSAPLRAN